MTTDQPPDTVPTLDLVRAAQAGDQAALEQLFRRYLPRVRQIVALRIRRPANDLERVEDLVQDSLVKALSSLDRFEERSEGTFRNWIARCVQSAVADHFRRQGAKKRGGGRVRRFTDLGHESLAASLLIDGAPSPSELARQAELEGAVEEALLSLDDHYREAIILVKLCGMSYAEAAAVMGFRNPGNVRQIVFRAIRKLRAILGTEGGGGEPA